MVSPNNFSKSKFEFNDRVNEQKNEFTVEEIKKYLREADLLRFLQLLGVFF